MSNEQGAKAIHHSPFLPLILASYLLLALAYGLVNPLFEAPDEHLHFFTAVWIADHNALPSVPQPATERFFVPETEADWLGQEAAQPPLYYLLASFLVRPFDTDYGREQTIHNPFVRLGDASAPANRNAFIHAYDDWRSNPAGHVWAAHLLRALSAVIGLGTLVLIHASARLLWPESPYRALLAVSLVAFLPQFTFQHSAISNDVLVTFLATAVLYQLLRLEIAPSARPSRSALIFLGLTIGLTGLTKNQGTALLVYVLGFVFVRSWVQTRPWGDTFQKLLLVAIPALTLIAPLWWRNYLLYGDITAVNQFIALAGGDRGYTLLQVLAETPGLWLSLFANFGWFNILAPAWVYWFWTGLVLLAVAGAVWQFFTQRAGWTVGWRDLFSLPVLLAGWVVLVYASLVLFMLRTPAAQGRLLFPALLPLALGLAYGLSVGFDKLSHRPSLSRWLSLSKPSFLIAHCSLLIALNLFLLTAVLRPVYAPPPTFASPETAPITHPVDIVYPDLGRLVGYQLASRSLTRSDVFPLTLFWATEGRTAQPVTEFVQLVLENGERVAGTDTFHGRGNYSTAQWQPAQLFADELWLEPTAVLADPCHPAALRLNVGLRSDDGQELPTAQGATTTTISLVRLAPAGTNEGCEIKGALDTAVSFADQIALVGLATSHDQPDNTLDLTLTWRSLAPVADEQVVFVHLLNSEGNLITAYDSPPTTNLSGADGGVYPTTLWQPSDTIRDKRSLVLPADLPPDTYQIFIGLYRPTDFARLPIVSHDYVNHALPVFEWVVDGGG